MRRMSVLLFVFLAAVSVAPAANDDVCVRAWTEGRDIPNADSGFTCASYHYGLECGDYWVSDSDPEMAVRVHYCIPALF